MYEDHKRGGGGFEITRVGVETYVQGIWLKRVVVTEKCFGGGRNVKE